MKRPRIHLTAPRNWLNDPVGFCVYRGEYHLFYQHFPYAPRWGTMHWGHAVSLDLAHWEQRPIALFPTCEDDKNGCFSGSAIECDGKLLLYYTGVRYNKTPPKDIHVAQNEDYVSCQMCLESADGKTFDNFSKKRVVIPTQSNPSIGHPTDTRDPKVWREKDWYYMLLGSRCQLAETGENAPELLLYRSADGMSWELHSRVAHKNLGFMWECPDLFRVNQRSVLSISPMRIGPAGSHPDLAMCGLITAEPSSGRFNLNDTKFKVIDAGLDYYAPQSTLDMQGRRIQIGWLRSPCPLPGMDWIGVISLPRVVSVRDGQICFSLHPNIKRLFRRQVTLSKANMEGPLLLRAEFPNDSRLDLGGLLLSFRDGIFTADRSKVFPCQPPYPSRLSIRISSGPCTAEIVVDSGVVEIYLNDGEAVLSTLVYSPSPCISGTGLTHLECLCESTIDAPYTD